METLEYYYFPQTTALSLKGKGKGWGEEEGTKYFIFREGCAGTVVNSLEELAKDFFNKLFWCDEDGNLLRGTIWLYRSLDENLKGKPHIKATRENVVVSGAVSPEDDLLKLQEYGIEIINKGIKKEMDSYVRKL